MELNALAQELHELEPPAVGSAADDEAHVAVARDAHGNVRSRIGLAEEGQRELGDAVVTVTAINAPAP